MLIRSTVLWVHVLCGVVWIGTCLSFVLASAALAEGSDERRDFALRTAPRINRINVAPALIVPITGAGNLFAAALARKAPFPPAFTGILALKVVLFLAMGLMLAAAFAAERAMREGFAADPAAGAPALQRLVRLYAAIAALGAIALMLGLWLAGT